MATGGKKPVHIADVTKADLLSIKSIGEAKADRILNLREENGGTLTLHDLQKSKVVSNSVIKKLQHPGFIIFSDKNVSPDNKVCSSQEHLVVQVGAEDSREVEEMDDEDSDDQYAFPDKESLHLSGTSTDQQKLQLPKVELSGSSYQVFPSQGTAGLEPETSDSIPILTGKPGLDDIWSVLIAIKGNTSKTEKSVKKLESTQVDTSNKVTKLFRTVEELNRSVHSTHTAQLELKSRVDGLDQRVTDVEEKHQKLDRVESDTAMLKSDVSGLTSSQQEVMFNCYRDVSNLSQHLQSKMQETKSRFSRLDSRLDRQVEEYDQQKTEFPSLKSRVTQHQVMLDRELESVKETQRSQEEAITSLQQLEIAENQRQQEVSLLHQDLDGLAQQVQVVKEEVQNLKHAPCDHNPSISKHRTGVEQDVAFQALQKDLENSFTELSKLVTENEAALQKHEQILVQQKQQLEGVADENCLDDIEKAFERNVNVQSKIFEAKRKPTLEKVNRQLRTMRDTFNLEYELPSNLPGLQWTGLDLRPVSEFNYPGSSEEQTIAKVPQKQVRMSQPLYTPVPSYLRATSRCSTPRIEDQDECIQRVSAAIREKSPNGVYNNKTPRVSVVSQVNDNVHVSSDSSEDEVQKKTVTHKDKTKSKIHVPKLSFEGEHWNGYISQFELVAKTLAWTESEKIHNFAMSLKKGAAEYYGILPNRKESDFDWLKKRFQDHFGKTESPAALRWELLQTEQREDENLEKYLARMQGMIVSLFPDEQKQEACSPFFVDAFMKGCRDKAAVLAAAGKHPTTLEDAYKFVQDAMQLRKAILGKKASARSVKYVESDSSSPSTDSDTSTTSEETVAKTLQARGHTSRRDGRHHKKFHKVISGLHKVLKDNKNRQDVLRCYNCGEPGHFAQNCPRRRYDGYDRKQWSSTRSDQPNWRDHQGYDPTWNLPGYQHNGPRRDRYTPPGTPERFPSSSQGYQRNTYGSPRSGQYHPSQYRDYRRSPQRSDDSNWRTSPRRDNQRYHSPPPPPRNTQGFKGSSDSTMRPSSMGEKSNVTFSDSVKSLN